MVLPSHKNPFQRKLHGVGCFMPGYQSRVLTHAEEVRDAYTRYTRHSGSSESWPDRKRFQSNMPLPEPRIYRLAAMQDSQYGTGAGRPQGQLQEDVHWNSSLLPHFIHKWAEYGEDYLVHFPTPFDEDHAKNYAEDDDDGADREASAPSGSREGAAWRAQVKQQHHGPHSGRPASVLRGAPEKPPALRRAEAVVPLRRLQQAALERLRQEEKQLERIFDDDRSSRAWKRLGRLKYKGSSDLYQSVAASHPPMLIRTVALDRLPLAWTLATLTPSIRGGNVEKIAWDPHRHNRPAVRIAFVTSQDAFAYYKFVTEHGGIPWLGAPGRRTFVSLVAAEDGGTAPIGKRVLSAIKHENARRCFRVKGLPAGVGVGQLRLAIHRNAAPRRGLRIVFESIERDGARHVDIRMASIEAALAARDALAAAWPRCVVAWIRDDCAGALDETLLAHWAQIRDATSSLVSQLGAEAVLARVQWGDTVQRKQYRTSERERQTAMIGRAGGEGKAGDAAHA